MIYWIFFVLWFLIGVINLAFGNITRMSYACVWVVLMWFMLLRAVGC